MKKTTSRFTLSALTAFLLTACGSSPSSVINPRYGAHGSFGGSVISTSPTVGSSTPIISGGVSGHGGSSSSGGGSSSGTAPTPGPTPTPLVDLTLDATHKRGALVRSQDYSTGSNKHIVGNILSDNNPNYAGTDHKKFVSKQNTPLKVGSTTVLLKNNTVFNVDHDGRYITQDVVVEDIISTDEDTVSIYADTRRAEGISGISPTAEGKVTVASILVSGNMVAPTSPNITGLASQPFTVGYIAGNALKNIDTVINDRYPATGSQIATYQGRADFVRENAPATILPGTSELKFDLSNKSVKSATFASVSSGGFNPITFNESDFDAPAPRSKQTLEGHGTLHSQYPSYQSKDSVRAGTTGKGVRGYFYGDKGEFTAGTFFNHEGYGTFIAGDTSVQTGTTNIRQH